jgi:hypothetical protein
MIKTNKSMPAIDCEKRRVITIAIIVIWILKHSSFCMLFISIYRQEEISKTKEEEERELNSL